MWRGTLRTKFLLALALITSLVTTATLLLVRHRVEIRVRGQIERGLRNSVITFQTLQQQREATLERSAALVAALPPLKAVMTSQHTATIQDASAMFWRLAGSQLFVLADDAGALMALHTSAPGFTAADAQNALRQSQARAESRGWWAGGGHLFEVFLQPIYFGSADDNSPMGVLAVGYEIDRALAADLARVAAGHVEFRYQGRPVVSTLPAVRERFLTRSVRLSGERAPEVTLTVLKSYDEAMAFLRDLNRWIVAVGIFAVLAGSALVFFVSTTFTRPLAELVSGVRALERGDFAYPLQVRGHDEVSDLTRAFQNMRVRLRDTQKQLLDSERLATIGRMASTISHDLRHPLTAILAYAEFLAEGHLDDERRKDCFQEIRIAVNRMTDEINSLMGFSKQREVLRPAFGRMEDVIERAIQTVKVLPEFEAIEIRCTHAGPCEGWFDPGKVERVMLNLLFNACEVAPPDGGKVEVTTRAGADGIEIRVADNGPGIPEAIRENLFHPFVSHGKEKGIGLGLTVVQKIMQDHGGEVSVESTGPAGTVFRLTFPAARVPAATA